MTRTALTTARRAPRVHRPCPTTSSIRPATAARTGTARRRRTGCTASSGGLHRRLVLLAAEGERQAAVPVEHGALHRARAAAATSAAAALAAADAAEVAAVAQGQVGQWLGQDRKPPPPTPSPPTTSPPAPPAPAPSIFPRPPPAPASRWRPIRRPRRHGRPRRRRCRRLLWRPGSSAASVTTGTCLCAASRSRPPCSPSRCWRSRWVAGDAAPA